MASSPRVKLSKQNRTHTAHYVAALPHQYTTGTLLRSQLRFTLQLHYFRWNSPRYHLCRWAPPTPIEKILAATVTPKYSPWLRAGRSGIESWWGRDFPHLPRPALGPTQPPVQWVPGLSRGKERLGRDADPSPLIVPWPWKGRAIPLLSPMSRTACTEPRCLYRGALYLYLLRVLHQS